MSCSGSDGDDDDDDEADDGMIVDEGVANFHGEVGGGKSEFDDDQLSLNLRESDEETETESVMIVSG